MCKMRSTKDHSFKLLSIFFSAVIKILKNSQKIERIIMQRYLYNFQTTCRQTIEITSFVTYINNKIHRLVFQSTDLFCVTKSRF